jgi:hypothetical protein
LWELCPFELGNFPKFTTEAACQLPENCSAHVPMILKEFFSSKINGLVMKTFSGK